MEDDEILAALPSPPDEGQLTAAPVLSTPAELLFEHPTSTRPNDLEAESEPTDDGLADIYETARTAREIKAGGWSRIALQFPDTMLRDAPRVVGLLNEELSRLNPGDDGKGAAGWAGKIYILADTSYSACCVDEVAAEHADAEVVVHYGRSCLSPTARLPVLYVFTEQRLDIGAVADSFEQEIPEKTSKVILMADITYQSHIPATFAELQRRGYTNIRATEVVHDPSAPVPNRRIIRADDSPNGETGIDQKADSVAADLQESDVFHVSAPPTSLLLSLSAKVRTMHIYPTSRDLDIDTRPTTRALLSRRYAKVLTLATAGVIGILVNTLSVANYLSSVDSIRKRIAAARKKSYTVVVGKLNPAKLANFAEIEGWVVVGCWESSLVEEDAGYYRPVITPFELEVALMRDDERIWGHKWWGGIEEISDPVEPDQATQEVKNNTTNVDAVANGHDSLSFDQEVDEDESAPPEFDLRTGKLISHSRPMQATPRSMNGMSSSSEKDAGQQQDGSTALALRPKAELATINGVLSPGAEFLRSQRQWQGLGSDFDGQERSSTIEEGRCGVARGYTVGEDADKR